MIERYTVVNRLGQTPTPPLESQPAVPAPAMPEAPVTPKARWVNEGGNDLTRTLLAAGTVAAIAIAGIYFFK